MTEQTDAANAAATGNSGNVGNDGAAKTEAVKEAPKTPAPTNQAAKAPEGNKPPDTVLRATADHDDDGRPKADHSHDRPAGAHLTVNDSDSTEARLAQQDRVKRELEERSAANEEGHAKNMAKAEEMAQEAQARTSNAHDRRAGHTPTGRQVNHNTPRVLKDGTKVWD